MYENNVKLIGYVGNVNVYQSEGKKPFAKVTLATPKSYINSNGERVVKAPSWHTLRFFGESVNLVSKLISKGTNLYVSGELEYDEWDSKLGEKHISAVINVKKFIVFDRTKKSDTEKEELLPEFVNAMPEFEV